MNTTCSITQGSGWDDANLVKLNGHTLMFSKGAASDHLVIADK